MRVTSELVYLQTYRAVYDRRPVSRLAPPTYRSTTFSSH